jgi:hypothetical protein
MARDPVRARGKLYEWNRVVENNAEEFPDPKLPTYEGLSEFVEGDYVQRHVSVPEAGIDYVQHLVNGFEVDPATVQVLT